MKEFEELKKNLDQLREDFNKQLSVLSKDTTEFHNSIINLSGKYPEHKELLEFIVHINDKLEMNHFVLKDILMSSFNDLIESKKQLIEKIKNSEESSKKHTLLPNMKEMKDIKIILIALAIILAGAAIIISPDSVSDITKIFSSPTQTRGHK